MLRIGRAMTLAGVVLSISITAGCASREEAYVQFSYVVEPVRGLPHGMKTIAIMPASIGPNTDPKWSDLCAELMSSLVNQSRIEYGADIIVSDRRDTQVSFDEADLAAAGMSTGTGGAGAKLQAIQGAILSNVNVKVETHEGRDSTITDLSLFGGGGRGWGYGGGSAHSSEVETVTRNMTVQSSFKIIDASNNQVWEHYQPKTFHATEKTEASPIFGSSETEAELTPRDQIIGALVEDAAREFISKILPCRIDVEVELESSRNDPCVAGFILMRQELYPEAVLSFDASLREFPDDHEAAFAAGVCCEASGKYDDALKYYKRAYGIEADPKYIVARDRMKTYGSRVRTN